MRRGRWLLAVTLLTISPIQALWGADYLFLSARYLTLTESMIQQATPQAGRAFEPGSDAATKFALATEELQKHIQEMRQARLFKKLKPELVSEVKDKQFADHLNTFKFGLRAMASKTGKSLPETFAGYEEWIKTETSVVQQGVEQRLTAFETRFGPESEQLNFVELLIGEALLKGNESAPSAFEPIFRLSAVQLTTSGPGLTSSFQVGMNRYFLQGPGIFRWIGVSNHVGVAASLQYLSDPRLMRFSGRPSFGLVVHVDRKEIGASWDPDRKTVRMSLGYAFQFIPLLM